MFAPAQSHAQAAGRLVGALSILGVARSPGGVTRSGDTFIRYESANLSYSRITATGGVKPGTFAAPSADGVVPLSERALVYNLPDPEILRSEIYVLRPPGGTPIVGPRPVVGGTGNEVIFPYGY